MENALDIGKSKKMRSEGMLPLVSGAIGLISESGSNIL